MTKLLCLFSNKQEINKDISYIFKKFAPIRIFIYEYQYNTNKIFYTFTHSNEYQPEENIILIHRKSETNTLYTINAINELIKQINNGVLDKSIQIPWNLYTNHLLLLNNHIQFNFIKKVTN